MNWNRRRVLFVSQWLLVLLAVASAVVSQLIGVPDLLGASGVLIIAFLVLRYARLLSIEPDKRSAVEAMKKQGWIRVTVMQNGPFKTTPSGSGWYKPGARINLVASPEVNHAFKSWISGTSEIEIVNPASASTTARLNGSGVITANFY